MFFDVLYNTHYAAITLGLDFVRNIGYIQIAESLNKQLKPNQITKGMKVYDYDNSFYMNILTDNFVEIDTYITKALTQKQYIPDCTIYTDQSKSSYNQNIGKKTLVFSLFDKNTKQLLVDKNGNIFMMIYANMQDTSGQETRSIIYKCSEIDIKKIKAWASFGYQQLPGLSAFVHQLTPYFTNKSIVALKQEYFNSQRNNGQYNQSQQSQPQSNAPTFEDTRRFGSNPPNNQPNSTPNVPPVQDSDYLI